jgi:high-affinity nickel-transport protein
VAACVLALLVIGWGLDLVGRVGGAPSLSVAGALALALGMRHAFDADHVAAIDDCTRLFVFRGERPTGVGLFFAMGHSVVVLALSLLVALAAHSTAQGAVATVRGVGGSVSAGVAASFLLVVGLLNLRVLRALWREDRQSRPDDARIGALLSSRGILNRFAARRFSRFTATWQLMIVGMLFGLGLETASEVALLGLSAEAAAADGAQIAALLALPLLFAGGMALFDSLNSLFMMHMYTSSVSVRGRLRFNIGTTAVTAVIALVVAGVYASVLLVDRAGVTVLEPLAAVADHFEVIGYAIVTSYLAVWAAALLSGRRADARAPSAAATPAATSNPEV